MGIKDIIKKVITDIIYNDPRKSSQIYSKKIKVEGNFRTSIFRLQQNQMLREAMRNIPKINTVLNLGAVPDENDKEGSKYVHYFKGIEFYTLDKNRGFSDPRHLQMDLHDLSQLNKKFDLILLMSTLEHVKNPFIVAEEIKKIMSKGSYLFISSPFFYPIHKDVRGRYSDYWRFTDDALRVLFGDLKEVWIKNMESSIISVRDRGMYWETAKVPSGFCALFKKE